jgi:CubicO group peptidase (beta-lactamase class C family)
VRFDRFVGMTRKLGGEAMSRSFVSLCAVVAALGSGALAQESAAPAEMAPKQAAPVETVQAPVQAAGTETAINTADLENFVDGLIASQLQAYHVPGATVAIVKDGKPLLVKGYGLADIEHNKPVDGEKTLFRIGSIGKTFARTAIMQLAEQGKLTLDDDVNQYIKSFQIPATFKEPIRIRHLMTHSTGLEPIVAANRSASMTNTELEE